MRAELGLPSVRGDDDKGGGMMGGFGGSMGGVTTGSGKGKRPIQVKFEIPYFTTSGIQVRYLKIIEPKVREMLSLAPATFPARALDGDVGRRADAQLRLLPSRWSAVRTTGCLIPSSPVDPSVCRQNAHFGSRSM